MRAFSPFRLDHVSQIANAFSFNQTSLIIKCNRFCESRIFGVASQDFNTPFYGPCVRSALPRKW